MINFLLYILLFLKIVSSTYLTNPTSNISYYSLPDVELLKNTYPYSRFSCTTQYNDYMYLITGSNYYDRWINTNYNCNKPKKYVGIFKYNLLNNSVDDDYLLLGEQTNNYPTAVGGKSSGHIVSCGIDKTANILYYVASNKWLCASNYNSDSAIVRVNISNLDFMDRTLLSSFSNKESFYPYTSSHWDYRYINNPLTSTLIQGDSLWIGFDGHYTGIWKLNILSENVELLFQYQKKTKEEYEEDYMMEGTFDRYFQFIRFSFIHNDKLYFVEDNRYQDARLMEIDYNGEINENTTNITVLDGINNIEKIEFDRKNEQILILAGSLASELFKYDYNFTKLNINTNCNIDFLKFPAEWGKISNIEVDAETGFAYVIIPNMFREQGIALLDLNTFEIVENSHMNFGETITYNYGNGLTRNYYQNYAYLNISFFNYNSGELVIFPSPNAYINKFVRFTLSGCTKGKGIVDNNCESCLPGKYSDYVGGFCKSCLQGYSNQEYNSYHCEKCKAGTYSNKLSNIECKECPAGYFANIDGSNICKGCVKGKYSIVTSSKSIENCLDCEEGKVSNIGNTTCIFCELGEWAKERKSCVKCPKGRYGNLQGLSNYDDCEFCVKGKYSNVLGIYEEDDCKECSPGKIGVIIGATSNNSCIRCEEGQYMLNLETCEICPDGWIAAVDRTECIQCELGKWASIKKECIECPLGTYSQSLNIISEVDCLNCQKGTFNSEKGSTSEQDCEECPIGKIGSILGAQSITYCTICLDGEYRVDLQTCEICPDGWISQNDRVRCNMCELGKWADTKKECVDCPLGKYSQTLNIINEVDCLNCQKGKFNSEKGSTSEQDCEDCPIGKIGNILGAQSSSFCIKCEEGKYRVDLQTCEICPDGWISQNDRVRCNMCELGKWGDAKKKCVDCPLGKYSQILNIINEEDCLNCPKGKYSDVKGNTNGQACKECDIGMVSYIEGATSNISCIQCAAGKYKLNLRECVGCPHGWASNFDRASCEMCPVGKFSDENRISCMDCPTGYYNDILGLSYFDICKSCDIGKYSNTLGAKNSDFCIDCPLGKYSFVRNIKTEGECKNCPTGYFRDNFQIKECTICPIGKYISSPTIPCVECPLGKYSNDINTNYFQYCEDCSLGRFNDKIAQHKLYSCQECEPGKWNSIWGANSSNLCIECNLGKYSEEIGATTEDTCISCTAGKYNSDTGANSPGDCRDCATGSFSTEGASLCINCVPGKYSNRMASIKCNDCEVAKYSKNTASILCFNCPENSEQTTDKTYCICSSGSYNTINITDISCELCSDEYICNKGTTISTLKLKQNYWRHNALTTETYKCKNRFACKGGIVNGTSDTLCYEGHKGPICDICEKGWAKDDGVCLKCPENVGRTMSLTILIPLVCILLIIFLIKTANPSSNKKEEVNGVVKIFMNYAQVFSLASSFQINWPGLVRYYFERAKEFSSPRVSFYSSDCAIGWSYYDKLTVYLSLPLVYILTVTFVIFLVSLCFCQKKKKKLKRLQSVIEKNEFKAAQPSCMNFFLAWEKTAIVVGTFLSWPTIVEKTLEVLNCEEIGDKYYLVKDVSVECYDSQHYTFLTISYIALGVYGVGIPLLGFRLLYKYRYRLFDMQNRYDGSTPLSFLFLGYREKRWYYEFIIMGKKACLILISVFLRNHPRYQIIAASLLIQVSFFLHVFLRPYDTITSYGMICNKLESISLLSLVMTLSTGLFFGTVDSGYELGLFEDVLIVLLLMCNGGIAFYFFIYFVVLGFKTGKQHLKEKIQVIFNKKYEDKFCCCFSQEKREIIKEWGFSEPPDDYGIHLKTNLEKDIFVNYFKEKQSKLDLLNKKIDKLPKRRLSIKLDKLRSEIQVMEKQRCWNTVQNNRLYLELKKTVLLNKGKLTDNEKEELNKVFELYVHHGIKFNKKMNNLYMSDLEGMMPEDRENIILEYRNAMNSDKSSEPFEINSEGNIII